MSRPEALSVGRAAPWSQASGRPERSRRTSAGTVCTDRPRTGPGGSASTSTSTSHQPARTARLLSRAKAASSARHGSHHGAPSSTTTRAPDRAASWATVRSSAPSRRGFDLDPANQRCARRRGLRSPRRSRWQLLGQRRRAGVRGGGQENREQAKHWLEENTAAESVHPAASRAPRGVQRRGVSTGAGGVVAQLPRVRGRCRPALRSPSTKCRRASPNKRCTHWPTAPPAT